MVVVVVIAVVAVEEEDEEQEKEKKQSPLLVSAKCQCTTRVEISALKCAAFQYTNGTLPFGAQLVSH